MKKRLISALILSAAIFCFAGCGKQEAAQPEVSEQSQEIAAPEDEQTQEEAVVEAASEETEEADITYISCTADELMQECVNNPDSAKEKYQNQYVEITGILREIGLEENANPAGKIVRMDTSVEVTNASCQITGITWGEEDVTMEAFQKAMEEMQPGDTVTMKVYIDSVYDSSYDYYFDLYGVEKQ